MRQPEFPYPCPMCKADLEQPGAVRAWIELPEKLVGHLAPGDSGAGKGVILIVDKMADNPPPRLECTNCNGPLYGFQVEDICGDCEMETEEEEEEEEEEE